MAEARPEKQKKINGEKGLYGEYSEFPEVRLLVNQFLGCDCTFGQIYADYIRCDRIDYETGHIIPINKRIKSPDYGTTFCGFCGNRGDYIYDHLDEVFDCGCRFVGCKACNVMFTKSEFDIHHSFKFKLKQEIDYRKQHIKALGTEIRMYVKDSIKYEKTKKLIIETQEILFGLKFHYLMED
jgi:hypothetical protein